MSAAPPVFLVWAMVFNTHDRFPVFGVFPLESHQRGCPSPSVAPKYQEARDLPPPLIIVF